MDNNFSNILNIFKRLDESTIPSEHEEEWYDENGRPSPYGCYDAGNHYHSDREQDLDAGYDAYKERNWTDESSAGTKFVGYATAGMNAKQAKKHMVGGCEEDVKQTQSLEDKLRARWEETKKQKGLLEFGAPGTASAGGGAGGGATANQVSTNSVNQAADTKELNLAQANLNKLKSAGVNLPTGVSQAAKSAVTTAGNPGAVQGQGMDQNAKKTATALGQEMEKLVTGGNPGQISQLANAIKKMNMGQQ